jgi:hypothetical protein
VNDWLHERGITEIVLLLALFILPACGLAVTFVAAWLAGPPAHSRQDIFLTAQLYRRCYGRQAVFRLDADMRRERSARGATPRYRLLSAVLIVLHELDREHWPSEQ